MAVTILPVNVALNFVINVEDPTVFVFVEIWIGVNNKQNLIINHQNQNIRLKEK
jgi:hypothetical protein